MLRPCHRPVTEATLSTGRTISWRRRRFGIWRGKRVPTEPDDYLSRDLDRPTVEKAYSGWAPVYDLLCGPIFRHGRKAAVAAACRVGGRALEIGVGTGLSFRDYDRGGTDVVGIDISPDMLARAEARLAGGRHRRVEAVHLMDAHHLDFPDASFDVAVCQFVITLVENPEQVLSECARVVRPGGEILVLSHLYSETGWAAATERWFAKRTRSIGLRPEFPFARLIAWADAHGGATLVERRPVRPFYTLVRFRVNESAAAGKAA